MPIHVHHQLIPSFPKLGWAAVLNQRSGTLHLLHGPYVETGPWGLVEGVWDGNFSASDFHRVEHLFGTGVRVDGDEVHFVPSCAHVDRILYVEYDPHLIVSNSLPILLASIDARLRPELSYIRESHAITAGIMAFRGEIPVSHGSVSAINQVYHKSLVAKDGEIHHRIRTVVRSFADFDEYTGAIRGALARIGDNRLAAERRYPLDQVCTLSSGYDSPAVAVLARDLGLRRVYTSRSSNSNVPKFISRAAAVDDGTPIAMCLGLDVHYLNPPKNCIGSEEIFFSASGTSCPELVFHRLFRDIHDQGAPAVLYSGYYGDTIWGLGTDPLLRDGEMRWPAISGLALSEARLWAGIIHAPLPFLYARSIESVFRISHSQEMKPWRLGVAYDRPIPRRIVEEAGVPRGFFGRRKKAVVQQYRIPYNADLRREFFAFARSRGVPGYKLRGRVLMDKILSSIRPSNAEQSVLLHHWSVEQLLRRYRNALEAEGVSIASLALALR